MCFNRFIWLSPLFGPVVNWVFHHGKHLLVLWQIHRVRESPRCCGGVLCCRTPPTLYLFLCITYAEKPVFVEAFIVKPSVKVFDIGVISWFACSGICNLDNSLICPLLECLTGKLWAIINAKSHRIEILSNLPLHRYQRQSPWATPHWPSRRVACEYEQLRYSSSWFVVALISLPVDRFAPFAGDWSLTFLLSGVHATEGCHILCGYEQTLSSVFSGGDHPLLFTGTGWLSSWD